MGLKYNITENKFNTFTSSIIAALTKKSIIKGNIYFYPVSHGEGKTGRWPWNIPWSHTGV